VTEGAHAFFSQRTRDGVGQVHCLANDFRLVDTHILQQKDFASWLDHPTQLAQPLECFRRRAINKGGNSGVKAVVGKVELLGVYLA
jgi:hypothetical protein